METLWIGKRLYFVNKDVVDYVEKLESGIKQGKTDLKHMATVNMAKNDRGRVDKMINDCANNFSKLIQGKT